MNLKLVLISDTHGQHRKFQIPDGDVLIHAGDFVCDHTDPQDIVDFATWLKTLPHKHKIVIAGNHDRWFEYGREYAENLLQEYSGGATYLQDSGTEIDGIKFWGSPVQPEFCDWAFNRKRGEDIQQHWDLIPEGTDVLITHGPPAGFRDWTNPGQKSLGCRNLRETVAKIKPKLHVFGHIHGGYGADHDGTTYFVNAALLDEAYQPKNKPVVMELSI